MEQVYIKDKEGNKVLPITSDKAVRDENGNPLDSRLNDIKDALDARYTKQETYNKNQLNNLITTPNQKYVTVEDYASLPESGEADTTYRVANWDGSLETPTTDITKYSEYAWDGTGYIFLSVKSQIGEVYDISAANSGTTYADLADALGTDGANVPASIRRGGMSIRFVQTSDNKYVQYRYMGTSIANADFTNVANWQGVDEELKRNSQNLITSGAVEKVVRDISLEEIAGEDDQIVITDDSDNIIASVDSNGINAVNLYNNGQLVATNDSVIAIENKVSSIAVDFNNEPAEEIIRLETDSGVKCTSISIQGTDNNYGEELNIKYDDNTDCLKVGREGLFVNGEKIEIPTLVPPIRKLFNYKNIICCGDSVTEGYVSEGTSTQVYINRVVSDRSYPAQLQKMFPGLTVTTKARSGDDASEWRGHFYATTDFSEYDLIIFELGLNGFLNINDIDTEGTNTYNYRVLIQDVRTQNADAVIVLVRSSHFAGGWMPVLNYIAQESDCIVIDLTDTTYLNLDTAIYHGYLYQNNEFIFDWAHFTRKGYNAKAYVVAHLIEDKLTDETIYN